MNAPNTDTSHGKIAEILVRNQSVTTEVLDNAAMEAETAGVRLESYLVDKQLVSGDDMTLALAEYLRMPPMSLSNFQMNTQLLDIVRVETMQKHKLLPLALTGKMLTVACGDPFDIMGLDELHTLTGLEIVPVVASERDVGAILTALTADAASSIAMEDILADADEANLEVGRADDEEASLDEAVDSDAAPVIRMVNMILLDAMRKGASDIHLEPMEKAMRLRYRVDGGMKESPAPPKTMQAAVISRIKILSDLNIAERRIPQDGRFKIKAMTREIDIRVSILPTVHGEKIVMRLLDKANLKPSLEALGLTPRALQDFTFAINQPHGIILVTGPTGSGKTTTLYSCLQELNKPGVNLVTCEDPVEYQVEGINQVQIREEVGLTFASALRSILRQDPDICLVGEIRDQETAEIAVKAAITGHLVLSTLHTNDAPGAVTRMVDMGVEPFMLGTSLIMTQAQRLYRKLCPACKKETEVPHKVLRNNGIDPEQFEGHTIYAAAGCPKCAGSGYRGRDCIMEIMLMDDDLRDLVHKGAGSSAIAKQAEKGGMTSLRSAGFERVKAGQTSVEEILRIAGGSH